MSKTEWQKCDRDIHGAYRHHFSKGDNIYSCYVSPHGGEYSCVVTNHVIGEIDGDVVSHRPTLREAKRFLEKLSDADNDSTGGHHE